MKKLAIILIAFISTISFLWFSETTPEQSQPEIQNASSANVFLQAGQEFLSATSAENPSQTPSATPTIAPSLTPTPTPRPAPTATFLTPQSTTLASPTPTQTPTPHPLLSSTINPTPTLAPQPSVSITPTPTPIPIQQETLVVVSLTTPIAQKQDASIVIKSPPRANCTIEVTWPSGSISTSKDLAPKTADTNGEVTWTWGINWNTKPGTAIIKLSCTAGGQTYSGQTTMQIIASQ